ncbi:galactosylgalactosylxylosylprotein 3-beta-glucuronosyltransferase P-like isoform X1 [Penaeus japonicus]|uniref:galactosylgalactosylxylosylprotein 3-beta-glucuronosyltransferase P-like isoform X1 n=2 Tax=Penaeus japonicus TaxID=27405 RepID=UPI001C714A2A|nr:galactosylgalactosylxylosylprotein 3-beta-glucuronosyltransferase P-like isoform X1 [Penaeus japonicus]
MCQWREAANRIRSLSHVYVHIVCDCDLIMVLRRFRNSPSMVRLMNPRLCLLWCGGAALVLLLLLATRAKEDEVQGFGDPVKGAARALHQAAAAFLPPPAPPGVSPPLLQKQQDVDRTSAGASGCSRGKWVEGLPPLYIITPTYPRAEQIPELTRTAQTLMNVPNVVWIVSEDAAVPTQAVVSYLNETGLKTVYRRVMMPDKYQKVKNKPRGVANRLSGLEYIRENAKDGVFYFADDDNSYDIRLFEQMRWTRKVSMFPVGLVTKLGVSSPIVRAGRVVGFYDGWISKRRFPCDMAGFAVNVQYFLERPKATMPFKVGFEEDGFLRSLGIKAHEIEPLAFNCTKIWVWHTQTKKNQPALPVVQNKMTVGTNLDVLKTKLWKGNGTVQGKVPSNGIKMV